MNLTKSLPNDDDDARIDEICDSIGIPEHATVYGGRDAQWFDAAGRFHRVDIETTAQEIEEHGFSYVLWKDNPFDLNNEEDKYRDAVANMNARHFPEYGLKRQSISDRREIKELMLLAWLSMQAELTEGEISDN
jgi:hypothetical protein